MNSHQPEQLVPLSTAGAELPVSRTTLRRWATVGLRGRRLNATRIGGRLYCSQRDVDAFLSKCNGREIVMGGACQNDSREGVQAVPARS